MDKKYKAVFIDFETTGTKKTDEILQVAICDEDGNLLMNEYCCPQRTDHWTMAQRVHHITPEQVKSCRPFSALAGMVEKILSDAQLVMAYNDVFEKTHLAANGIDPTKFQWGPDMMYQFPTMKKRPTLEEAALLYNYQFKTHDAAEDVIATAYIYRLHKQYGNPTRFIRENSTFKTLEDSVTLYPKNAKRAFIELPDGVMLLLCRYLGMKSSSFLYDGPYLKRGTRCHVIGIGAPVGEDSCVLYVQSEDTVIAILSDLVKDLMDAKIESASTNDFSGIRFAITGELESLSRQQAIREVEKRGGTVKDSISRQTNYLVVGIQDLSIVGPDGLSGKQRTVNQLNESGKAHIQIVNEEEFLLLLKDGVTS